MEIWPIFGITAAAYLIGTWLMVQGGTLLYDRSPANLRSLVWAKGASVPVLFLFENQEEQLEYAIRYALWTSVTEGIPLHIYLPPQQENIAPVLMLIRRNWPDLPLVQTEVQQDAFPQGAWVLDLRHT